MKAVACAGVVGIMVIPRAEAFDWIYEHMWLAGDAAGQRAASCTTSFPDGRPMSIPLTLVVSNDVPNGTVVHSFGDEMFGAFAVTSCELGTGVSNSQSSGSNLTGGGIFDLKIQANYNSGVDGIPLTDPGLRLRLFIKPMAINQNGYAVVAGGDFSSSTYMYANQRYHLTGAATGNFTVLQTMHLPLADSGRWVLGGWSAFAIGGEIVKVGTLTYPTTLSTLSSNALTMSWSGGTISGFLDGSGVRVVPPACQLRTTDYTIPMNAWFSAPPVLPAYGPQVPVNLSLECSGPVDHVRFRFEDTGPSLSGNKNISLYDTAGGSKIDGLEIELLYNGTKVNVDNTTVTDTGSHGATKASPASLPLYDSVSTAAFQARYVQNAAVTRAGADYTGPVTGKVNMYVTYD